MRRAEDYDLARLVTALTPPREPTRVFSWTLAQIRDARDQQLRGQFRQPVQMAASMRTDDAIFTAKDNRLAPLRSLEVEITPAPGKRGEAVAREAEALFGQHGIGIDNGAIESIHGALVDHAIAIGYNVPTVRDDGSRIDFHHRYWPLEHVRWDETQRTLMTQVEYIPDAERKILGIAGLHEVPITHGDGRWVVYTNHAHAPWAQSACVLAGALVWARHAHAIRDWAKGSTAHGNAKVVGEMPEGMSLVDETGAMTVQARAFLALLQAIASVDSPVGIRPTGSKADYITNNSTAWQVWDELVKNGERAAARIYLGTDGILGSVGGAPGVDIASLFGVATTKVQSDDACISRAFSTGVLQPWAAMNFGDSRLAPVRGYKLPDPDAAAHFADTKARDEAFHAELDRMRKSNFVVDQHVVNRVAKRYGVEPPTLIAA